MKKTLMYVSCGIILAVFLMPIDAADATELIWVPINPSFGGSPYNASWLMASAQAQNRHVEESASYRQEDPFEDFEYNLKRQYIYALSSKIIDEAFGEESLLPEGETEAHYTIGDFIIDIDGNGLLSITITDTSTGGTTKVEVPYY